MASTYTRKDSPFVYIRSKGEDGSWQCIKTGYRKDNPGERHQAELLARTRGREERERTAVTDDEHWDAWVDKWISDTYAATHTTTLKVYRRYWRRLRDWLVSERLSAPRQLTFPALLRYKALREKDGIAVNTIVHELKFLGVVMNEAMRRGFAVLNPCHKMGIKRTEQKHKEAWTDAQIQAVAAAIGARPDWMQATFILGYYQAARMRQCAVPLRDIDLASRRIVYWKTLDGQPLTKGNKPFAQPIAKAAVPALRDLITRRQREGHESLCDIPACPSLEWRHFLDGLGCHNISHHGLRATWITRAALSRQRISREEAKAFVNHGSTAIHEIYQRLNADDVAHVADALDLPAIPAKAARPLAPKP